MQDDLMRVLKRTQGTLDVLIVIPAGVASPGYVPVKGCKVWAVRGQIVNGPGTGASLTVLNDNSMEAIALMDFDILGATPTPRGVVDAEFNTLAQGEGLVILKGDEDQSGWVIVTLGFDLTQIGPVP
jgi:hypothetical protein